MTSAEKWIQARRLGGLRRFAVAITVLNLLGHTWLGFEQSWAQPLLALTTTYSCELFAEWIDARAGRWSPRFMGGWRKTIDFLLPAHITGLAIGMLLYSGDRVLPTMFAAAVAIASKATLRVTIQGQKRHFLNPSNCGITAALLLFPWVGISPPYHFTENLGSAGSLILPALLCVSGTLINARFTGRLPLILGWITGFILQAVVRSVMTGAPLAGALNPMTGVAFLLFTFYMVSDPATTPFSASRQALFGLAVAGAYGVLVLWHVAFGFFFALTLVAAVRGLTHQVAGLARETSAMRKPAAAVQNPMAAMSKRVS
jgi:enediyne biosynthesis protein E5